MTVVAPDETFAAPASAERLDRAAAALTAHGFTVEVVDDAAQARDRVQALLPDGAAVYTAASETLRLSGIEDDINASSRYEAVKPRVHTMDRAAQADEIRRITAAPDVVVGSVAAVTETGSLVAASATGSQLPAYTAGARQAIWVAGAQKIVPDLATALRRVETYAYPLEDVRARAAYGRPTMMSQLLVINADPFGRGTVLLVRQPIGY